MSKIRKGYRIDYEDDLVEVYDNKGKKVYQGILDYCPYKVERHGTILRPAGRLQNGRTDETLEEIRL